MNALIREKVARVNDRKIQVGYKELTCCVETDIEFFNAWLNSNYSVESETMEQYIELMQIANGFNHNSLYIYGISPERTDNVYEMNTMWQTSEEDTGLIFLGHNDLSLYCLDTLSGDYYDLDRGSMSFIARYATFDEMLIEALGIAVK
ncbi:MAG: SMI1/KNR4 family protein [Coriobacteriales bacterium]|jgi:hypothetical protein|nr:SMI1/KNR4 family protein [Coriobacteriales bacterium]